MAGALTGLFHIAIKTGDLARTRRFYLDVLGMVEVARPEFGFPGAWIAAPVPGGGAIFHIYAGGPALGRDGVVPSGTGAIDHVSVAAVGFHAMRERLRRHALPFREFVVPGTTIWQVFVYDPSGVQLEITFEGRVEGAPAPDLSPGHAYVAGDNFFAAEAYAAI